jgi:hypothetical protein
VVVTNAAPLVLGTLVVGAAPSSPLQPAASRTATEANAAAYGRPWEALRLILEI